MYVTQTCTDPTHKNNSSYFLKFKMIAKLIKSTF